MKLFRDSQTQTVALGILVLVLFGSMGGTTYLLSTQNLGYSSGFQGPKATFAGIKYDGKKYDNVESHGASMLSLQNSLLFDADYRDYDKPNIEGELTSVFIPSESLSGAASWVPTEWLTGNNLIQNPQKTYAWNITAGNSTRVYKMEQWVLKFYVSFSAHWELEERAVGNMELGQNERNAYTNLEVWIEFDLEPTWYIASSGGTAYFAIGKIALAESVREEAKDNTGTKQDVDTQLSVIPESEGASLYIYYGMWGLNSAEVTEKTYEGKQLNPQLFRDKVYAKITLSNFGIRSWNEAFTVKTKGDVATFDFNVYTFVIGQWDVKDIQNIPEDFGRTTKTEMAPSLLDYLSDPRVQALLTALAMAGIFLLILIVAPGFLIAIIALFMGRRRR